MTFNIVVHVNVGGKDEPTTIGAAPTEHEAFKALESARKEILSSPVFHVLRDGAVNTYRMEQFISLTIHAQSNLAAQGSDRWQSIWEHKATQDVATAAGRSNYGPSQARLLVQDAVNGLSLKSDDTLLDIGCSQGLMGELLAPMVKRYVGVDLIPGMVERFRKRCGVEVYTAPATCLPFADGEFTATLLSSVLLVLSREECEIALREMRRVTASGGRGFVSGNVNWFEPEPEKKCPDGCVCYQHVNAFKEKDLFEMLERCGWKNPRVSRIAPELQQSQYQYDVSVDA